MCLCVCISSIMKHFETVSGAVASNPKSANKSISKDHIAFSSTMVRWVGGWEGGRVGGGRKEGGREGETEE